MAAKLLDAFHELEKDMDPTRNMQRYRNLFHTACHAPPVVPFFALFMKDLTFMREVIKFIVCYKSLFKITPFAFSRIFDRATKKKLMVL